MIKKSHERNNTVKLNTHKINEIMRDTIFSESPCQNNNAEEPKIDSDSEDSVYVQPEYASSEEVISSSDEYVPSRKDMNMSDSDSSLYTPDISSESDGFVAVISKKKQRRIKKKGKQLFGKNSHSTSTAAASNESATIATELTDIADAKKKSLQEAKKRQETTNHHSKRLDILLKSNGLRRDHVPAQGSCFFEAEKIDALNLRNQICDHLEINSTYYSDFITSTTENILDEIVTLRQPGYWATNLSDTLPLAIANLLGVKVKIYSSSADQPVIVIFPTLMDPIEKEEVLLAYLSVPGYEHYNSVKQYSESEPKSYDSDINTTADISIECTQSVPNTYIGVDESYTDTTIGAEDSSTPVKENSSQVQDFTPRKQAKYQSPLRKKLTRKRKTNPGSWKKNIGKRNVRSGKEYQSVTGKNIDAKCLKPHGCTKCRFNCANKVDDDTRLTIFNEYWNLQSYERQRDFICSHVLERESLGSPTKKKKQVARTFSFQVKGQNLRVCKQFFISTLGIGRKTVETALKKKSNTSSPIRDKRGRHTPYNKTPTEDLDSVREHIESFPVLESHYSRKDTNRKYLNTDLSIRKIYELYKTEFQKNRHKFVKELVYRHIFCSEYNISFHKPKKD